MLNLDKTLLENQIIIIIHNLINSQNGKPKK